MTTTTYPKRTDNEHGGLKHNLALLVVHVERGDWWVVTHLLNKHLGFRILMHKVTLKELAKNGIIGLCARNSCNIVVRAIREVITVCTHLFEEPKSNVAGTIEAQVSCVEEGLSPCSLLANRSSMNCNLLQSLLYTRLAQML